MALKGQITTVKSKSSVKQLMTYLPQTNELATLLLSDVAVSLHSHYFFPCSPLVGFYSKSKHYSTKYKLIPLNLFAP